MIRKSLFRASSALLLFLFAVLASAQLSPSAWPKFRADEGNSGRSISANTLSSVAWSTQIGGSGNASSPTADANDIVYVGGGSTLYAIGRQLGGVEWTFPTSGTITSAPTVASDGTVYVGSWNLGSSSGNNIYAINN